MSVVLVILIGIADMAQVFFVHQTLVHRVQTAARWAAVNPFDAAKIKNLVLFNRTTAPDGATSGFYGLTASMITAVQVDSGTRNARVVVSLDRYPYKVFSPLLQGTYQGRPIRASVTHEQ